uniref:Uncharacterized protein n=1 Tax=viral metagenome TaxID=1070528 RepID=A0A6M3KQI5_9ZZZZ
MAEIRAELKAVRNVSIAAKVTGDPPKVVTAVKFEYDGEPSEMQNILLLESQGQKVDASFHAEQLVMDIGENMERGKAKNRGISEQE